MRPVATKQTAASGFTLVEIMIVTAIIALLALLALPAVLEAWKKAQNSKFAHDARVAAAAFTSYNLDHGFYPPDANHGVMPAGMEEYLSGMDWLRERPLGGYWDWEGNAVGYVAAVSAQGTTIDNDQALALDTLMDDGRFGSGILRKTGTRISYVIEE